MDLMEQYLKQFSELIAFLMKTKYLLVNKQRHTKLANIKQ